MVNVTGWTELMDGKLISASFTMFDTAFAGWIVAILFIVYQFMLILKTRNMTLAWVTGIIFVSMYITSVFVKTISVQIIVVLLIFELAAILYMIIWK